MRIFHRYVSDCDSEMDSELNNDMYSNGDGDIGRGKREKKRKGKVRGYN